MGEVVVGNSLCCTVWGVCSTTNQAGVGRRDEYMLTRGETRTWLVGAEDAVAAAAPEVQSAGKP